MKDMKRHGLLWEFNAINKFFEKSPNSWLKDETPQSTVESMFNLSNLSKP